MISVHFLGFRIARRFPIRFRLSRYPYDNGKMSRLIDGEWVKRRSWLMRIDIGSGAGYRWIDFPGYQMNVNAPWYRSISISGYTARVGWYCKFENKAKQKLCWHCFTKNANIPMYPGWW